MRDNSPCIDLIGEEQCLGCFACQAACPQQAVKMVLSADGFYRPRVDRERCDACGLCHRRCPGFVKRESRLFDTQWPMPKAFAAWAQDECVRLSSSSGGVFSEIATEVLKVGGVVAGCVWGADWTPRHVLTDSSTVVAQMRGSKYIPSRIENVYREVLEHLRMKTGPVLFSGTPCQVAAMALALGKPQRKRVLLVEVVCHGVPSLRVFHQYLRELFQGEDIASYSFRDKSFGWQCVRATSLAGRKHHLQAAADPFIQGFAIHHLYLMHGCYACPFAQLPRVGDLTLGDFWGCPERWYDKRGVSLLLVNTPEGMAAIQPLQSRETLAVNAVSLQEAAEKNPRVVCGVLPIPRYRQLFLKGLVEGQSFQELQRKYFPNKLQILWRSFQKNQHKVQFLSNLFLAFLRRLGKQFT